MAAEARADRIRRLIAAEPNPVGTAEGLVTLLTQLCRTITRALPAIGSGVSFVSHNQPGIVLASSGPDATRFEELQFTLGEGPCLDAYASRRPVLEPDLAERGVARWPGYSSAMTEYGVQAVFAFPMQVGAARLGILDVYRCESGPLSSEALNDALDFAEVGVTALLDSSTEGTLSPDLDDALGYRSELYQAQGMVMIQLGVTLTEAMARIRAHAYAHNVPLGQVARGIVDRTLRLSRDQ